MTKTEHLLVCLSEECAEVIKAVSKALRFGLNDRNPKGKTTNLQDIARELCHTTTVSLMLSNELGRDGVRLNPKTGEAKRKWAKVEKYMKYAQDKGTLK